MKIYLPNDADGNTIPSNVTVMYEKNGTVVRVDELVYGTVSKRWRVKSGLVMIDPSQLYLNKSDNLKRLAADLDRTANDTEMAACTYLNREKRKCNGCKFQKTVGIAPGTRIVLNRFYLTFPPASTICAVMPNECQGHRQRHHLRAVCGR